MPQSFSNLLESFLDGLTGAGLFGKLLRPGTPTEFIDSRSIEEFTHSRDKVAELLCRAACAPKASAPNDIPNSRSATIKPQQPPTFIPEHR